MKILSDIIHHEQFNKGIWLLPLKRPSWYYFMRKSNTNIIRNPVFLRSVDYPLRELVRFLHGKGFKTTPSCSGHFRAVFNYEKVYESLKEDEAEIRKSGLQLKNIESGEMLFYRDENYSLPFTKSEFINEVMDIQHRGSLGIRFGNNHRIKKRVMSLEIPQVVIKETDGTVCIHTSAMNRENNERIWKKITSEIKYIFQWIEFQQPHGVARVKRDKAPFQHPVEL